MQVAYNVQNNRVFADEFIPGTICHCPICKGQVIAKVEGKHRIPHFAHKVKTDCLWGKDKDYKSPWHIRMQNYFPREQQEVLFTNSTTGEVHIADVFIESANTVIEFQHSSITDKEFAARTSFHLMNDRRIVWVFDQSEEEQKTDHLSTFIKDERNKKRPSVPWPHQELLFKWAKGYRTCLHEGPAIGIPSTDERYSICVFTGNDGSDTLHRIIRHYPESKHVVLSLHDITISPNLNADDFFKTEQYWCTQSPLKEKLDSERALIQPILDRFGTSWGREL